MPSVRKSSLRAFLQRLPKTETHLHIEGALPWELLSRLDPVRYEVPPLSWKDNYKFRDFEEFETRLLDMAFAWFTSPERYYEAASLVFKKLHEEERVRYVETSFASGMIEFAGLDGNAVADAVKAAAPDGLPVKVFMGIHHNGYTEHSRGFIEDSLNWSNLDGLDLHGMETTPLESWTAPLWKRAREAGKFTKAHAGEFLGPEFVWRVVEELGVTRIQHGVRSIESPKLVDHLREIGAVLDVCPISNVKLGVVEEMRSHPLRDLMQAGITCTISTDDPVSFGNTLSQEYEAIYSDLGLSLRELGELASNGFRHAMDDPDRVGNYIAEIDSLVEEYSRSA